MRRELAAAGAFDPRPTTGWIKFICMLAACAAITAVIVVAPWWVAVFAVPLAAIPAASAAMIGHEAAHGSFSRSKRQNALMLHLAFPLLTGLGASHWKNKHNHLHHSHPNVPGTDADIEIWPFAATAEDYAQAGRVRRFMQRSLQPYLFWPLTLFLAFFMRYDSVRYLVTHIRRRGLARSAAVDATCIAAHYTLWLIVPSLWFGALSVIAFYVALWAVVGLFLAMIFSPAHMGLPFIPGHRDKWLHQLETTRNLRMPRWLSWLVIGLDHQVEHHLFPQIPHSQMTRAQPIIERWCREHGAPYQQVGYAAGLVDVTRFLATSWRYDPEAPRPEPLGTAADVRVAQANHD